MWSKAVELQNLKPSETKYIGGQTYKQTRSKFEHNVKNTVMLATFSITLFIQIISVLLSLSTDYKVFLAHFMTSWVLFAKQDPDALPKYLIVVCAKCRRGIGIHRILMARHLDYVLTIY